MRNKLEVPFKFPYSNSMKIEIHIDNTEIDDVIYELKEQGIRDVTRKEIQSHFEEYIRGAVEDSKHERLEQIVESIVDLQVW